MTPEIDRTGWLPGPWRAEPDRKEWITKAGLPAVMQRNHLGAWCGYVGVPPKHPWYGVGYSNLDVEVHGGLTYAGNDAHLFEHTPFWWFGFDCSHSWDYVPGLTGPNFLRNNSPDLVYRDATYVHNEVESLAKQLSND